MGGWVGGCVCGGGGGAGWMESEGRVQTTSTGVRHNFSNHCYTLLCHRSRKTKKTKKDNFKTFACDQMAVSWHKTTQIISE